MRTVFYDLLTRRFPSITFLREEPLSLHTYFKIGGPAEVFVAVKELDLLEKLVLFCKEQQIPFLVLGSASNVLLSDEPFSGLVIRNMTAGIQFSQQERGVTEVTAETGVIMNLLVRQTIDKSLEGLEYFLGLPGTVGGAVYNNSHFLTQLVGDVVKHVDVLDAQGHRKRYEKDACNFTYDSSIFQQTHETLLSVTFSLKHGDKTAIELHAKQAVEKRATTQPLGMPSSGCIFKNAVMPDGKKVGAGYLIDQCGLKGERVGDAVVSEVHANFIVNVGKATAKDVDELAKKIEQRVKEKFGIVLEREVFFIGQ